MFGGGRRFTMPDAQAGYNMVLALIGINAGAWLLLSNSGIAQDLALSAYRIQHGMYWQVVTAMFMHGNFSHLLFNMFGLYFFGGSVAPVLGRNRFLMLYLISGVLGNLLWLAANWSSPVYMVSGQIMTASVIGASGALFGVMLAAAMLFPQARVMLLFFPAPIKLTTLIIVYAVIETFSQLSGAGTGIAHLAHLGGFVGAYFYMRICLAHLIQWDPLSKLKFHKPRPGETKESTTWHKMPEYDKKGKTGDLAVSRRVMNELQDKISRSGINSLTQEEYETLKRIREQMSGNSDK